MRFLIIRGRKLDPNVLELAEKCRELGHTVQMGRLSEISSKVELPW